MAKNYVQDAIAEATAQPTPEAEPEKKRKPRKTYTEEEIREFKATGKTSGHKGAKTDRVNLAITVDNLEYIRTMGRVTGEGMSGFINRLLEQHRRDNAGLYEKAIAFKNALDEYGFNNRSDE